MSSAPILAPADRAADQFFADRAALVEGIAKEPAAIVADLIDAAGPLAPSGAPAALTGPCPPLPAVFQSRHEPA